MPVTCFRAYAFTYVFAPSPHTSFPPHLITVNTAVFFFRVKKRSAPDYNLWKPKLLADVILYSHRENLNPLSPRSL